MEKIKLQVDEDVNKMEDRLERFGFSIWGVVKKVEHVADELHFFVYYFLGIPVYVQLKFTY